MHSVSIVRHAGLPATILLLGLAHSAKAQTFIDTQTTINYAINDDVSIGLNTASLFTVSLVSGGAVSGYLYGSGNSTVDIFGGTIGSYLQADASSLFNIYGSDLTLTDPTPYFTGTRLTLQGTLQSGQQINVFAYQYDSGQFVVHNTPVPEPGSLIFLLGLTGAGFLARRRNNARSAA